MFMKAFLFAVVLAVVNSQYCSPTILPPCGCNTPALPFAPACGCLPALTPLSPCGCRQALPTLAPLPECGCLPNLGPTLPAYDFAFPTLAPRLAPTIASNAVLPAAAPYDLLIPRLPEALLAPYSAPLVPAPCGCQGLPLASPTALVNPFLPAASPVSALAPTVSSMLPPAPPCGCGSIYLRKIPIPPPCI